MQHLRDTRRPVILMVNGKAAAVVQDAEAYRDATEGIRQGFEDAGHGGTRPARAVFNEVRRRRGIPR